MERWRWRRERRVRRVERVRRVRPVRKVVRWLWRVAGGCCFGGSGVDICCWWEGMPWRGFFRWRCARFEMLGVDCGVGVRSAIYSGSKGPRVNHCRC